jgi:UDP-glucose 4-epimerase
MAMLVTGCLGRVGARVVSLLQQQGRRVVGIDTSRGLFEAASAGDRHPADYIQGDLQDAGAAYSAIARYQPSVVVHSAAIPDMTHNAPHVVMQTNLMSTFNVIEACTRLGVPRLVNISSLQVLGIVKSDEADEESRLPRFSYVPIDEDHPISPENPYALSKFFGEEMCAAAARRNPRFTAISLRPTWCVDESNIERNLGKFLREPDTRSETVWSYVCLPDVADAVARSTTAPITGHEVSRRAHSTVSFYSSVRIASCPLLQIPSKAHAVHTFGIVQVIYLAASDTEGGRSLTDEVRFRCGTAVSVREPLPRRDASGIDCSKALRLLGWTPRLSWKDYLDEEGKLRQPPVDGWF